jgi:hypothetical protein
MGDSVARRSLILLGGCVLTQSSFSDALSMEHCVTWDGGVSDEWERVRKESTGL